MLKIAVLLIFSSVIVNAQNSIIKFAEDSDAILLNHSKIAEYQINKISFTEKIADNQFIGYPISNIKYLIHISEYNNLGLAKHYEWSFFDFQFPQVKENDKQYGTFYISNEYNYQYENELLKQINISDASQIYKIDYNYKNDSIFQIIYQITNDTNNNLIKNKYNSKNKNILIKNTGIKQNYEPDEQIIDLKNISSNTILINNVPFSSFFVDKFDNKRFLIEICPSKWIFFELND